MTKTIKIKSLIVLLLMFLYGCGSPSDQDIKSLVALPEECMDPIEFKEITVGSKQTINVEEFSGTMVRSEWYPVRVTLTATCLPDFEYSPDSPDIETFESLFGDDEAQATLRAEIKQAIENDGVETSFTMHYRFQKNEYGEWEAFDRQRN